MKFKSEIRFTWNISEDFTKNINCDKKD